MRDRIISGIKRLAAKKGDDPPGCRLTGACFPLTAHACAKEEDTLIRIMTAIGMTLLVATPALAHSYCHQVRRAVATYGYSAVKRYALAHYTMQEVRAGERCLRHRVRHHQA
jgi:hypothetical protein